ncbi:unnamed protein product [Brassicogethes aeneus]|uniref:STING ligand-binding domain-containing protein n=1 Tax=Brassicogethes aeneus TaxID=1431903 RepID=A0A9P0FRA4_BRAAE|nr:unnamed protein product [Brassicogethes aeneus]
MESQLKSVRSKYVRKKLNGQTYYPPTLPRVRKHYFKETFSKTTIIIFFVSLVFFLIPMLFISENLINSITLYSSLIIFRFMCEYLHRFILLCEEKSHIKSRYNNKLSTVFSNFMSLSKTAVTTLILSIIIVVVVGASKKSLAIIVNKNELFWLLLSIFMLMKLLNLNSTKLHMSYWISQNYGIDYGAGMAYSFYHGYLKLLLTKIGIGDVNLKENMELYESHHDIKFEVYKLFILIPKSLNCYESLEEGSKYVECASSMLEKKITRAGVKDRVYKNSVYKIFENNKDIRYVLAEYATPLKTFIEVVKHTGQHSETYKALESDIVHQFYITLQMILKENHLNTCELLYYEDEDTDVGALILSRIKQLKKDE